MTRLCARRVGRLRPPRPGPRQRPCLRLLGSERGSAVVEFVFLGVLLLIPLVYLVLMLGRLQAGAYAVSSAARESGRAFVTAENEDAAAARAHAAAALAFANMGFVEGTELSVACLSAPCLTPGAEVRSRTEVRVPLPLIPAFARSVVPLEIPLSAENVSRVDRFRATP